MKIKINGQEVEINDSTSLTIEFEGDLSDLIIAKGNNINQLSSSEGLNISINVTGDVEKVDTTSGDVYVQGKSEKIKTMSGDVTVRENVEGNIKTMSGDVDVRGSVTGNVDTMSGDITHK